MIKSITGFMFACFMSLSSLGCVCAQATTESFYCDTGYSETGTTTTTTEYIYYDSYTISTDVMIEIGMPGYANMTQTNSCAPMAASILIGYYDVTCTDLIPDYEPGYYYEGVFYYYPQNSTAEALKEYLYDLMGTNTESAGTSLSQFKTGLNAYVSEQGYSIKYTSCGNTFSTSTATKYIQLDQPVVMFLNSYKYYNQAGISRSTGQTSMICKSSSNGHVLVAYGYREFNYYVDGSISKTDKFMIVAFGDGTIGYLSVNDLSCVDYAYAINIY